jgi:hypothetical protein
VTTAVPTAEPGAADDGCGRRGPAWLTRRRPPGRPCGWARAGSALALAQSGHVAEAVSAALGRPVELVRVQTEGDVNAAAIAQIGGTGVFVTALRDALLAGTVDLAVHSYKDLPTAPAEGSSSPPSRPARTRATCSSPATG